MTMLLKAVSIINLAARCNKINSCVYIDSNTKKLLDTLVNYNLIEYVRLGNNRAYITFKYKNFKPILKSIKYMGSNYSNNIKLTTANKEFNTKKALYIISSNIG